MSVHDAEPGDVYVDSTGKLWRVVSVCKQPSVTVEEVEGHLPTNPAYGGAAIAGGLPSQQIIRARQSGGVHGLMWTGFKRIWRRDTAPSSTGET